MKHQARTLRIIGGNWRSRKVTFAESEEIRPTGDRIRETLFNWLMHDIAGSRCLDMFAGSGILGMEALSRGASHVTFLDSDTKSVAAIKENLNRLDAIENTFSILNQDALNWLPTCKSTMDIVFLDPPFSNINLLYEICDILNDRQLVNRWVYIETSSSVEPERLPHNWQIHRTKTAGDVSYALIST